MTVRNNPFNYSACGMLTIGQWPRWPKPLPLGCGLMGEADVSPITRGEGGGGTLRAAKGAPVTPSPTHQDPREAQELEDGSLGGGDDLGRGLRWRSMKGQALPQLEPRALGISPSCSRKLAGQRGWREAEGAFGREAGMGQVEWGGCGSWGEHSLRPTRAACQNQLCKDPCPRPTRGTPYLLIRGMD